VTLSKSLRPRHRYVFFEVETLPDATLDEHDLRRALWFEAQNLYGDVTSAETRAELIEYDGGDATLGVGVVRCAHDCVDETRAALAAPMCSSIWNIFSTFSASMSSFGTRL
jgi:ribonuclease P/MRP protein subunit POP5